MNVQKQPTRKQAMTMKIQKQGSHSFTDKKIQDFSKTFQDLHEKFSRTFSEPTNA